MRGTGIQGVGPCGELLACNCILLASQLGWETCPCSTFGNRFACLVLASGLGHLSVGVKWEPSRGRIDYMRELESGYGGPE